MKIEQVKVKLIKPYEKNAKKHPQDQIEKIAVSIQEFGFNQPLVLTKDNVLIVGHGRYEAAKMIGLETVPAIRKDDLSPEQIKAYRLADNRLNESGWDMSMVTEELKEIQMQGFDIQMTGFELQALENQVEVDSFLNEEGASEEMKRIVLVFDNDELRRLLEAEAILREHFKIYVTSNLVLKLFEEYAKIATGKK